MYQIDPWLSYYWFYMAAMMDKYIIEDCYYYNDDLLLYAACSLETIYNNITHQYRSVSSSFADLPG